MKAYCVDIVVVRIHDGPEVCQDLYTHELDFFDSGRRGDNRCLLFRRREMAELGQCIDATTDYDAFRRTEEEQPRCRREGMLTMFGIIENNLDQLIISQIFDHICYG